MTFREIRPGIYSVGAVDWERRLFDELIPLPDGTSYNSYLIKGAENVALIDTVDPTKERDLIENLRGLGIRKLDYVISNHAEQDHSGALPKVLETYPEAKVVTNQKCKDMLIDLLLIPDDRFITVTDREAMSLGDKTLEFIMAPWVHWPETMFTYLKEDRVLFTCDYLGSHLATSDLYATDEKAVYEAAKRYYAEIMMPFRIAVRKNLEKIQGLAIDIIATSHGPIYNKPEFILNAYRDWASDEVRSEVVVPYTSMHGSTRKMVNYFVDALIERGLTVKLFDLTRTDLGKLAVALVDASAIVLASPTVLVGPHPNVAQAAYLVAALRPKARFVSVISSFGWGGRMIEQVKGMLSGLKVEFLEPVEVRGYPREKDFRSLDRLADELAGKVLKR
jgi:flavorubredoxin